MKYFCSFLIIMLMAYCLKAETGHQLWLRNSKAVPVNVVSKSNSPLIFLAKDELQRGWNGKEGATIELLVKEDKAIKGDGFRISPKAIRANSEKGILYGA
ncbi:MAG: hypothetical protein KA807_20645, partial [Prolixibacteraceae bacterium]|nr:hypothetical protein [Prolixibacteraceae bacterium]